MQNILISAILFTVPAAIVFILFILDIRSFGGDKLIKQYGWSKVVAAYVAITATMEGVGYLIFRSLA